jgi:hypothetical protein
MRDECDQSTLHTCENLLKCAKQNRNQKFIHKNLVNLAFVGEYVRAKKIKDL